MKNIIAAVAMFASSVAFAGPQFQHWQVVGDTHIQANADINDRTVSLTVSKDDAKMSMVVHAADYSDIKGEGVTLNEVMSINGQSVKVEVTIWENGAMLVTPKTVTGNNFVNHELWSKSKVYFKLNNQHFWFSGKGVQKAWKYLVADGAI